MKEYILIILALFILFLGICDVVTSIKNRKRRVDHFDNILDRLKKGEIINPKEYEDYDFCIEDKYKLHNMNLENRIKN